MNLVEHEVDAIYGADKTITSKKLTLQNINKDRSREPLKQTEVNVEVAIFREPDKPQKNQGENRMNASLSVYVQSLTAKIEQMDAQMGKKGLTVAGTNLIKTLEDGTVMNVRGDGSGVLTFTIGEASVAAPFESADEVDLAWQRIVQAKEVLKGSPDLEGTFTLTEERGV